jgi:SHS2 domain-containing protein
MPTSAHWEHFSHDADMGVRGIGTSKEEAFEQAALALSAVVTDVEAVRPTTCVEIECTAPDDGLLLVEWLNAIIYEMATRRMLFAKFAVQILDGGNLAGKAWGEAVDPNRHDLAVEVKGATFTDLHVRQYNAGLWHAQCVVDV